MWATELPHSICNLHILTPSYEELPVKVLQAPIKIYGKGAGSQLPVFTVKSTGFFFYCIRWTDWEGRHYSFAFILSERSFMAFLQCILGAIRNAFDMFIIFSQLFAMFHAFVLLELTCISYRNMFTKVALRWSLMLKILIKNGKIVHFLF